MSFYCNVLLCNANSCVKQNKNVDNRASENAKCEMWIFGSSVSIYFKKSWRNLRGEIPTCFLKWLQKEGESLNPQEKAISVMV